MWNICAEYMSNNYYSSKFQYKSSELIVFFVIVFTLLVQYAGVWYEIYRHDPNEIGSKCENETFVANPDGTMNVWNQYVNQIRGYNSHRGVAVATKPTEPAAFLIRMTDSGNMLFF